MRILHLIQRYAPALGGAEIHLGRISAELAARGHAVTVATSDALDFEYFWDARRRRVLAPTDVIDGVRVRRFPVRHLWPSALAYAATRRLLWLGSHARIVPGGWLQRLARLTPWLPDLWRWLDTTDEPFDLVAGMTICFEPLLAAGLGFARRRGVPFVVYPLTHLGAGPRPAADALSRFYTMRHQLDLVRASDVVVAQTPSEKQFFVAQGVAPERVEVVGPGVDPDAVRGGNGARARRTLGLDGPVVLALSATSYDKGTVHVVEAVRRLWQTGRRVELVLAGALLEPFRRFLDALPPDDRARLHVLGTVDEAMKRDLLDACDLLAMPSRTDSFGLVYLEAWLCGKPVIGARTWGVTDVIAHGEDGLLVPFGDGPALSDAIAHLLDHPEAAAQMGARGRQKTLAQHTWVHKLDRTEAIYGAAVAQHGPHP